MPVTALTPSYPEAVIPETVSGDSLELTLNISQLRLLHHYTTVTARTLGNMTSSDASVMVANYPFCCFPAHDLDSETVFQINLVQTAFDYPFLLHAVLALAALHLSRLEGPCSNSYAQYCVLADRHHDAALNDFRATVRDIDHTNWKAVLMFAGALFPYSCTASVSASNDLDYAFSNFLTNLALTRRVRPMVTGFYNDMLNSELSRMIPDDVKGIDWLNKEPPAETEYVNFLLEYCETQGRYEMSWSSKFAS
jgi:hypothetical protein